MVTAVPLLGGGEIDGRINLRQVKALCVDSNNQSLDILSQTLLGFGLNRVVRAQSLEEAKVILRRETVDLILGDALLIDGSSYELVRWLRVSTLEPNRFAPVVLVTGHTQESLVIQARDCGASFVVAKPLTPAVLMQRLLWIARGGRVFLETDNYVGPDRRWHSCGVPDGGKGRRREDLNGEVGEATEPNMSQDEIDTLVKPQRMTL